MPVCVSSVSGDRTVSLHIVWQYNPEICIYRVRVGTNEIILYAMGSLLSVVARETPHGY